MSSVCWRRSRLFERFYTVGTNYYSTGLGLSIAKLLTERMDGQINNRYDSDHTVRAIDSRCKQLH